MTGGTKSIILVSGWEMDENCPIHKDKWEGAKRSRSERDSGVVDWGWGMQVVESHSPELNSWVHHLPSIWPGSSCHSVSIPSFVNGSYKSAYRRHFRGSKSPGKSTCTLVCVHTHVKVPDTDRVRFKVKVCGSLCEKTLKKV